ncbi:unnamed protein product [Calypogeia fissa]
MHKRGRRKVNEKKKAPDNTLPAQVIAAAFARTVTVKESNQEILDKAAMKCIDLNEEPEWHYTAAMGKYKKPKKVISSQKTSDVGQEGASAELPEPELAPRKKRGRPKGSKNATKAAEIPNDDHTAVGPVVTEKKRGRPKGSKNATTLSGIGANVTLQSNAIGNFHQGLLAQFRSSLEEKSAEAE